MATCRACGAALGLRARLPAALRPPVLQHRRRLSGGDEGRPRTPLAQAAWDYQQEAKARLAEDGGITTETAFEILANHRIRQAMAEGQFDNLPGEGKPLVRDGLPAADPAMKVLKNAGFKPEWVELGVEIRAAVATLREGGQASAAAAEEVARVNALIAKHNGLAPTPGLHIAPLVAGGGEGGGVVGKGG